MRVCSVDVCRVLPGCCVGFLIFFSRNVWAPVYVLRGCAAVLFSSYF